MALAFLASIARGLQALRAARLAAAAGRVAERLTPTGNAIAAAAKMDRAVAGGELINTALRAPSWRNFWNLFGTEATFTHRVVGHVPGAGRAGASEAVNLKQGWFGRMKATGSGMEVGRGGAHIVTTTIPVKTATQRAVAPVAAMGATAARHPIATTLGVVAANSALSGDENPGENATLYGFMALGALAGFSSAKGFFRIFTAIPKAIAGAAMGAAVYFALNGIGPFKGFGGKWFREKVRDPFNEMVSEFMQEPEVSDQDAPAAQLAAAHDDSVAAAERDARLNPAKGLREPQKVETPAPVAYFDTTDRNPATAVTIESPPADAQTAGMMYGLLNGSGALSIPTAFASFLARLNGDTDTATHLARISTNSARDAFDNATGVLSIWKLFREWASPADKEPPALASGALAPEGAT